MLMDVFPDVREDAENGKANTPPALGGSPVLLHSRWPTSTPPGHRHWTPEPPVAMPLEGQFWGNRYGQLIGPFGHVWSLAAPAQES